METSGRGVGMGWGVGLWAKTAGPKSVPGPVVPRNIYEGSGPLKPPGEKFSDPQGVLMGASGWGGSSQVFREGFFPCKWGRARPDLRKGRRSHTYAMDFRGRAAGPRPAHRFRGACSDTAKLKRGT